MEAATIAGARGGIVQDVTIAEGDGTVGIHINTATMFAGSVILNSRNRSVGTLLHGNATGIVGENAATILSGRIIGDLSALDHCVARADVISIRFAYRRIIAVLIVQCNAAAVRGVVIDDFTGGDVKITQSADEHAAAIGAGGIVLDLTASDVDAVVGQTICYILRCRSSHRNAAAMVGCGIVGNLTTAGNDNLRAAGDVDTAAIVAGGVSPCGGATDGTAGELTLGALAGHEYAAAVLVRCLVGVNLTALDRQLGIITTGHIDAAAMVGCGVGVNFTIVDLDRLDVRIGLRLILSARCVKVDTAAEGIGRIAVDGRAVKLEPDRMGAGDRSGRTRNITLNGVGGVGFDGNTAAIGSCVVIDHSICIQRQVRFLVALHHQGIRVVIDLLCNTAALCCRIVIDSAIVGYQIGFAENSAAISRGSIAFEITIPDRSLAGDTGSANEGIPVEATTLNSGIVIFKVAVDQLQIRCGVTVGSNSTAALTATGRRRIRTIVFLKITILKRNLIIIAGNGKVDKNTGIQQNSRAAPLGPTCIEGRIGNIHVCNIRLTFKANTTAGTAGGAVLAEGTFGEAFRKSAVVNFHLIISRVDSICTGVIPVINKILCGCFKGYARTRILLSRPGLRRSLKQFHVAHRNRTAVESCAAF